jgi:hypothetical protein
MLHLTPKGGRWQVAHLPLAASMAYSGHFRGSFLVSIDLSCQDLFDSTNDVVIGALMCFLNIFFSSPLSCPFHIFFLSHYSKY